MTSRYAAVYAKANGPGDARPTALQIVQDEGLTGKLAGKVIVITGATSGIGLETARALSTTGATLFLTARNLTTGAKALEGILEPGRVSLVQMDNNSLKSVRTAADEIVKKSGGKVNILIENAGVMGLPERQLTEDGHEIHFQTILLSHFLLFNLLKDSLLAAATPQFGSRVVVVSSASQRDGKLESDNYSFEKGNYDPQAAYSNGNLGKVYLANEINRRYSSRGLFANSLHPGAINTGIGRHVGPEMVEMIMSHPDIKDVLMSPGQGAATTVIAAIGKQFEGQGGKYLENCAEAGEGKDDGNIFGTGWVKRTFDPEAEARLWKDASKMVGVSPDA